jgi:hypothetical protein
VVAADNPIVTTDLRFGRVDVYACDGFVDVYARDGFVDVYARDGFVDVYARDGFLVPLETT